jgi:hypothetical protein
MVHLEWIVLGNEAHNEKKQMISKIRSHAMRATAASRKRSGTWGKHNQRQYPAPSFSGIGCITSAISEAVPSRRLNDKRAEPGSLEKQSLRNSLPKPLDNGVAFELRLGLPMPLSGIDQLAAKIGVNVLDLSALTTIHIGHKATSFLTKDPRRLAGLVGAGKLSYLTHVVTRYGSSCYLDDAVRCVATKVHRVLVGSGKGGRTIELTSYGKALRSLQSAIDLKEEWRNPDVLCAVQILSLYEVCTTFKSFRSSG